MNTNTLHKMHSILVLLGMLLALVASALPGTVRAAVLPVSTCAESAGIRACDLWAKSGTFSLPGGGTATMWGYSPDSSSPAGLPGPLLIANSGETLQITLHNSLGESTSLSIPGLSGPSDRVGTLTSKLYTYSSLQPGTYIYQAGPTANGERQVAMGMYGVLIVRPAGSPLEAYDPGSAFDDEAVLVMSEFDTAVAGDPTGFNMRNYSPKYYLFNGQGYPNTANIDTLAGNKVLLRLVNAGVKSRSLGVLGLRYTVLSADGSPLVHPYSAVAETLGAGQTADVLVSIPTDAPTGQKYAVYDSSLRLLNNNARFGGMLTFLNVTAGGGGSGVGPITSGLSLTPNPSNGTANITLAATVSDASTGGAVVDSAEYFIDALGASGTGAAMDASDAAFDSVTEVVTAVIDPNSISSGSHNVYVHGHDADGNWGAFTSITLVLDKAGPAVSGLSGNPNPSNGSVAVAISGTASDSGTGNNNVVAVEYFIDATGANGTGTPMSMNQTSPTVGISASISAATMSAFSEGYHWVHVHALDSQGNWGSFAQLQIGVDKTGPATSGILIRPNPNNGALPYSPSIQSVRVDATFTEPGAGPITSNIQNGEFFIDTACVNGTGILMTPADGLYNSPTETGYAYIPLSTINTLAQGSHTFRFHGRDAAGNWGPCSDATFVIDKTPPVVSGLSLTPSVSGSSPVVVNATADDATTGNSNIAGGEYFIDAAGAAGSGTAMTAVAAAPSTSITATIPAATVSALTEGIHTIYVRARDAAGNWSSTSSVVLLVDHTPPTFSGISLSPNSIVSGAASVTLNINGASDAGGSGVAGGEYWFGTVNPAPGAGTAFSGISTIIPTASLAAGTYTVRARIIDAAGNWSATFSSTTLTVTAPVVPQPSLYFSTVGNTIPPGVAGAADDADIYLWSGSAFSRVIDASGVPYNLPSSGGGNANVDGFDRVDATHFYMSFNGQVNVPGIGNVQDEDVVYYNAGTWTMFFDGSLYGLGAGGGGGFDLDAINIVGGTLYFSTDNNNVPPGAGGAGDDADIYRWNGGSSYTRVVDVSAIGVPSTGGGNANTDGLVFVDATHFYLSFSNDGGVVLPGAGTAQDEDVVYYNSGTWTIYFDGSNAGAGLHSSNNLDIDAFDLP